MPTTSLVRLKSASVAIVGAIVVASCASTEAPLDLPASAPPPPPPAPSYTRPPPPTVNQLSGGQRPAAAAKNPHRQYFDQRKGRYYYFDQRTHAYYWEDGTPRN